MNKNYRGDNGDGMSSGNHTASSSSVSSQRRNAIDFVDQEVIFERKPKKSTGMFLGFKIFFKHCAVEIHIFVKFDVYLLKIVVLLLIIYCT